MEQNELKKRFTYHAPKKEDGSKFEMIRTTALNFAKFINEECPEGREKALALTKLEEVVMWANAGIARTGEAQ